MQEQDAVLADIIREMREERGRKGGFDDSRLRERVEVLGPEVSLDVLRGAVSTAIVDRLGVTWDERYGELKRYKERFGDCNVPAEWARILNWVRGYALSANFRERDCFPQHAKRGSMRLGLSGIRLRLNGKKDSSTFRPLSKSIGTAASQLSM